MPAKVEVASNRLREKLAEEQNTRNELFARRSGAGGPSEGDAGPGESVPPEHMTMDQLVHKAVNTHKSTTQVAERALKVGGRELAD